MILEMYHLEEIDKDIIAEKMDLTRVRINQIIANPTLKKVEK